MLTINQAEMFQCFPALIWAMQQNTLNTHSSNCQILLRFNSKSWLGPRLSDWQTWMNVGIVPLHNNWETWMNQNVSIYLCILINKHEWI